MNAFDNGDDDEEEEDNDQEGEEEKPLFKRILAKVTQTRKTAVFPISELAYREDIDTSSQEIQPFGKDKSTKTSVGKCKAIDNISLWHKHRQDLLYFSHSKHLYHGIPESKVAIALESVKVYVKRRPMMNCMVIDLLGEGSLHFLMQLKQSMNYSCTYDCGENAIAVKTRLLLIHSNFRKYPTFPTFTFDTEPIIPSVSAKTIGARQYLVWHQYLVCTYWLNS